MLFAGTFGLVAAITAALSIASFSGVDLADAAVSKARSFADLMRDRSPGKRTAAQLIKTKHKQFRVLAEKSPPSEIPPAFFTPAVTAAAPPVEMLPAGFFPAQPILFAQSPSPFLPFLLAPFGGGVLIPSAPGGGGGGPGGGGGGTPPPVVTPPVTPPTVPGVPEPGTWMTMVLGFAITGWSMRRRRSGAKAAAPF